ncbi:MAG: hypothetical protein FWH21_05240 [Kiritimatiellaeota bacterium]|nr:hypothetical protein [Kiritimatiellota bacterium]
MIRDVLDVHMILCVWLLATAFSAFADTATHLGFDIHWPLREPSAAASKRRPLLQGDVTAQIAGQNTLQIVVRITRPSSEEQRAFWNMTLAYPEHNGWMPAVRVWDKDQQWLWPNLPYLLRATGAQRIDRYGGWDPGHHVDNDFAAILIRACDASGAESAATAERPLVSAEWYPDGLAPDTETDIHTVVHAARSDAFTIPLTEPRGALKIWLIYADFFGSPVPRSWPKEREFNGGILKFFSVTWSTQPQQGYALTIEESTPPGPTRFDWKRWHDRPTANDIPDAPPRLTFGGGAD